MYQLRINRSTYIPDHSDLKAIQAGGKLFRASVFAGHRVPPIQLTESALQRFAGTFTSQELQAIYAIVMSNDSLVLRFSDHPPITLTLVATNEFHTGDLGTLVFDFSADAIVWTDSFLTACARNDFPGGALNDEGWTSRSAISRRHSTARTLRTRYLFRFFCQV